MDRHKGTLIIEDHEMIVWALQTLIEDAFPDMMIFSALTFEKGLATLEKERIGYIILDIDLPGGNSTKMIDRLRKIRPGVKILIHTAMPEEDYALKYLAAGADGFLSKGAPRGTLPEALRMILDGKKYVSLATKQAMADSFFCDFDKRVKFDSDTMFTKRERQITRLLLQGKWTKEISSDLGIKLSTVSTHKLSIFEKMQVGNVVELFRKVQKEMPELLEEL